MNLPQLRYDANALPKRPVILSPTAYKYESSIFGLLKPQWKYFIDKLIEADDILIIGYSMPETDQLARSVIASAFQKGKANAKYFICDPSEATHDKYNHLFGSLNGRVYNFRDTLRSLASDSSILSAFFFDN